MLQGAAGRALGSGVSNDEGGVRAVQGLVGESDITGLFNFLGSKIFGASSFSPLLGWGSRGLSLRVAG